ncbi:MAG: AraC family ligand binding domain-containing protein [Oscillospiraceae bacterium]|nr:AraC family ligand binding domain-containing protein [Oscillospiraceae bacterium]
MSFTRYQIETNLRDQKLPSLLYVSYSKFEHDWPSFPHAHPFTEFYYIISGKGEFMIENNHFPVEKNDFVIVNPNIVHTEWSSARHPLEYLILGVENFNYLYQDEHEYLIISDQACLPDLANYIQLNTIVQDQAHDETGDHDGHIDNGPDGIPAPEPLIDQKGNQQTKDILK